jgi:uncharacterized membrane protein HdeD (DUF308 family)
MSEAAGTLKQTSAWMVVYAIFVIFTGLLAISLPFFSGIAVTILVGWLLMVAGVIHVVEAFHTKGAGAFLWRLLVGLVYVVGGLDIALHPAFGLVTLTLVLGVMLLVQGVVAVIAYLSHRRLPGAAWILINGLIAALLGAIILWDGPRAALWVIGTLVGINLIFSGFTRLMLWGGVRRAVA